MDPITDEELDTLQRVSFGYFLHEVNPANGLVADKTEKDWPSSIAATGLALACYPIGVERGFMSRADAVERTLNTLRFLWASPQGPSLMPPAIGASTTTFSTCAPGGVHGNASFQQLTLVSCSQAH